MLSNYTYLDLNLPTIENCYTALSSACMAGNYEIVCMLAQNGADVNKVDCMEQTPLIYCFSRMNEDENYFENKALALRMSDVLMQHGADPDMLSNGRTILMNFCRQNYDNMIKVQQTMLLEVVEYLVEHGADAYTLKCEHSGLTAYELALHNQQATKGPTVHGKIIDILTTTKQKFFHPKIQPRMQGKSHR